MSERTKTMNGTLIRCFIAIKLPSDIRNQIGSYIRELTSLTSKVKWVRSDNLHLTIKFLGEIEPNLVEKINEKLDSINQAGRPFDLRVAESGCFPGRNRPKVFWLGLDQNEGEELIRIQKWLEERLNEIGIERERRKFSPHLTIGRVKGADNFSDLYSYLDRNPFQSKVFKVEQVCLIRSFLKPTGAEYKDLGTYQLLR